MSLIDNSPPRREEKGGLCMLSVMKVGYKLPSLLIPCKLLETRKEKSNKYFLSADKGPNILLINKDE